ncbi:hypothetical protein [Paenibacillus sedimenti]|uniref:Uncharacterized protein n=1 Tax=Paenibacillus sedimenti TaxID=2770274 RepID=A0A926KS59_9BACL|nr:hypothetical protein [Paenibacillus sedimenti]MBD0381209.1 hypothetical protein [Paenibacillus sedimenti]
MIGLIIAIVVFNFIAFKTNKRLSANQIVHIWTFTTAFQDTFDLIVDYILHAYWYFTEDIDWLALPAHIALVPPVNMMFLNWFPFKSPLRKQLFYLICWDIGTVIYEIITLLPEPWGFFHYGWWRSWHSLVINPILMLILLGYYKWICRLEKKLIIGQ